MLALLSTLVGARAGAQTPESIPPALYGREIVSVSYTTDGGPIEQPFVALIEISAGRPLTEEQTGATIRNLFATRRFADVQIEAQPAERGVGVIVHLFRAFQVKPLTFAGKLPLSREELRRALLFSEGSIFQQQEVDEGVETLQHRLQQEGFLRARVTPEVTLDRSTFDATVVYRIDPGPRARISRVFFDGETKPFTPDELLRRAKVKPGDSYSESKARAGAVRVTDWLHKNSWLRASVELIAAQSTDDGGIMPVFRVSIGKKIVFETRGVKASQVRSDLRDLIEGQEFDEDLVLQYVENKREALQRKGHYRARVDYQITEEPETTTVTITVEEGPRFEIENVEVAGNASVPARTLLDLMVTHRKSLPMLGQGRLVDRDLDEDVSAIRGYYQTHGWVSVKIDKSQITEGSKPTRLIVTIPVAEGPRALVASRQIAGVVHVDSATLEKELGVKVGEPFNPDQARQDAYKLSAYYHDHGWREASVKQEFTLSPDKTAADVIYRVEEGMRSFFGKTIVRGNTRTDTARVTQLATWREGDPFSETKVIETQRNLSRAGVFRRVEVRPEAADPVTQTRNVEIELQEGRPLSVLYGLGYQYAPDADQNQNDPYAVAGVSYNNLFGRMLSAGLEGQLAISGRYRLQLSFRNPYLFNRDYPFTSFLFATREPIENVELERFGWVNEISHFFGRYLRVALRAEYQRIRPVNPNDISQIEIEDFPRSDQPIEEATIGPNFLYDRRDDALDPHRGYYFTGAAKYAFPVWKAEARYSKISGQVAYFRPLGKAVFAVSARAGAIFPYGPSDIQVPIAERFFGGKSSTNRGFDTDLLGIPGETVDYDTKATPHTGTGPGSCAGSYPSLSTFDCSAGPRIIGGNGTLAFSAEFRFPIAGPVNGAVFYDVAQVWTSFSDVNLRFEGKDGLRQSAGFGIRIITPIGPLRGDYGLPLKRQTIPFNVTDPTGIILLNGAGSVKETGRFFFSIGYPF